jgi:hypothetical protein
MGGGAFWALAGAALRFELVFSVTRRAPWSAQDQIINPTDNTQNTRRRTTMYLVAIAWMYVVLMMAVAEAMSSQGTVLGAIITFVLYGLLPLGLVLYIMGTPGRKKMRQRAEAAAAPVTSMAPDGSGHAAGDTIAPERKEP